MHGFLCDASAAVDDDVAYLVLGLAGLFADELALLFAVDEEDKVASFHLVIAARDDGLVAAADGHDAIAVVAEIAGGEAFVE